MGGAFPNCPGSVPVTDHGGYFETGAADLDGLWMFGLMNAIPFLAGGLVWLMI